VNRPLRTLSLGNQATRTGLDRSLVLVGNPVSVRQVIFETLEINIIECGRLLIVSDEIFCKLALPQVAKEFARVLPDSSLVRVEVLNLNNLNL
jgi:hypothetical protein